MVRKAVDQQCVWPLVTFPNAAGDIRIPPPRSMAIKDPVAEIFDRRRLFGRKSRVVLFASEPILTINVSLPLPLFPGRVFVDPQIVIPVKVEPLSEPRLTSVYVISDEFNRTHLLLERNYRYTVFSQNAVRFPIKLVPFRTGVSGQNLFEHRVAFKVQSFEYRVQQAFNTLGEKSETSEPTASTTPAGS